jgi:hypothetical protein
VAAASAGAEGRRKAEEWVIVGRAMGAGRSGGPAGVRAGDGGGRRPGTTPGVRKEERWGGGTTPEVRKVRVVT